MIKKILAKKSFFIRILRYIKYIAILGFFFFVIVFWYAYFEETSWGLRYIPTWVIYSLAILIFLPWELLKKATETNGSLSRDEQLINIKQYTLKIKSIIETGLESSSNNKRLQKVFFTLIAFMIIAETFVVREVSTSSRVTIILSSFWRNATGSIQDFISYLSSLSNLGIYSIYKVIYYVIGLIAFRQVLRYTFLPFIGKYENIILQRIITAYNQPNKAKLISYLLLGSIIIVLISFTLSRENYSVTVTSPFEPEIMPYQTMLSPYEEPLTINLNINDFDLENAKISGVISVIETDHKYEKGKCEDIYSTECYLGECNDVYVRTSCETDKGFPPLLFNLSSLNINGRAIPVIIQEQGTKAIANESNFSSELQGDNYLFPFNTYTIKITISPYEVWKYAKIKLNTNHRFFSISENRLYTIGDTLYFNIGYAPYYKILVIIILFALLFFLVLIWQANERETLTELSVGIFATIITLRSFLIPQGFSTEHIFLDEALLVYIALFLFVLFYKHGTTKETNSA